MSSLSSSISRFIRELLAPPGDVCLTCGSRTKLVREWPGICRRCAGAIPWIFRPRCAYCGRAIGCPDCLRPDARLRSFVMNRSAVRYNEMMREWLAQYKYRGHERYAALIVKMLSHAFVRMQHEISSLQRQHSLSRTDQLWRPDLVTYVPVSSARLAERGFNQAQVFAEGLGRLHGLTVADLLVRSRHTEKQSFKTRLERIQSMRSAFEFSARDFHICENSSRGIPPSDAVPGTMRILIIDDIYTTGGTLNACATVIRQGVRRETGMDPEIYSLTWARS